MKLKEKSIDLNLFFNDPYYLNATLKEKEMLTVSFFHSYNWKKVKPKDRIILLKEFERVIAIKENRRPYEFDYVDTNEIDKNFIMGFAVSSADKKIWIRKSFLEKGIQQSCINNVISRNKVKFLNLEILDSILHEQYHINTLEVLNSSRMPTKEINEFITWSKLMSDKYVNLVKQSFSDGDIYLYRFIPDEYYAFKHSFAKIVEYFLILQRKYGHEKNLLPYLHSYKTEEMEIVDTFNKKVKQNLTFDEAYRYFYNQMVDKSLIEHQDNENLDNGFNSPKQFVKKI